MFAKGKRSGQGIAFPRRVFKRPRRRPRGRFRARPFGGRQLTRGRRAVVNGESKFFDQSFTDAVVSTGGDVIDSLIEVAQGITESTRIGRKMTIKSFYMKFVITLPSTNGQTGPQPGDVVRIIVYIDHQCNGATLAVSGANGFLQAADFLAFRELVNTKRLTTIMDRTYALNFNTAIGVGGDQDTLQFTLYDEVFKKLDLPIEFSGVGGAITDLRTNNIGFLAISQNGLCAFIATSRIRFTDG